MNFCWEICSAAPGRRDPGRPVAPLREDMPRPVRLSFCLNAGARKGHPQCTAVVAPTTGAILQAAANKLRLKKKEQERVRLFVWGTGMEVASDEDAVAVCNDALIAISLGEPYAGPVRTEKVAAAGTVPEGDLPFEAPPQLEGRDDSGRRYRCIHALWADQAEHYTDYYAANRSWWDDDGYGGATDEEAMIGDGGTDEDVAHSLRLLDEVRAARPGLQLRSALDCGAGVGRVTKHVLLRRCERVYLLEACDRWLKQARRYLGKKRSASCTFVCERLENHLPKAGTPVPVCRLLTTTPRDEVITLTTAGACVLLPAMPLALPPRASRRGQCLSNSARAPWWQVSLIWSGCSGHCSI